MYVLYCHMELMSGSSPSYLAHPLSLTLQGSYNACNTPLRGLHRMPALIWVTSQHGLCDLTYDLGYQSRRVCVAMVCIHQGEMEIDILDWEVHLCNMAYNDKKLELDTLTNE